MKQHFGSGDYSGGGTSLVFLISMIILAGLWQCDSGTDFIIPPPVIPEDTHPAWSPAGAWISYNAFRPEPYTEGIFIMDSTASKIRYVAQAVPYDWTPDSQFILSQFAGFILISICGDTTIRLTDTGGNYPRMSADGTLISSGRSIVPGGIWIYDRSRDTTWRWGSGDAPADWAPDGSRFVYSARGQIQIGDTSAPDQPLQQLTHDDQAQDPKHANTYPTWSPDGKKIAWIRGSDLWVMQVDGAEQRRIVRDASHPDWGPDSRRIVYQQFTPDDERIALFIIDIETLEILLLTGKTLF
jgi:Tol biopolymer transport system component